MVNKSVELIIRPEAEEDIKGAFQFYEDCSKGLGSDFLLSIDAMLSRIQRNPSRIDPTVSLRCVLSR